MKKGFMVLILLCVALCLFGCNSKVPKEFCEKLITIEDLNSICTQNNETYHDIFTLPTWSGDRTSKFCHEGSTSKSCYTDSIGEDESVIWKCTHNFGLEGKNLDYSRIQIHITNVQSRDLVNDWMDSLENGLNNLSDSEKNAYTIGTEIGDKFITESFENLTTKTKLDSIWFIKDNYVITLGETTTGNVNVICDSEALKEVALLIDKRISNKK